MFYVLEFETHTFKTCGGIVDVKDYLKILTENQLESVVIINRVITDVEMDVNVFSKFCENW